MAFAYLSSIVLGYNKKNVLNKLRLDLLKSLSNFYFLRHPPDELFFAYIASAKHNHL